jgi:hypothetical protein
MYKDFFSTGTFSSNPKHFNSEMRSHETLSGMKHKPQVRQMRSPPSLLRPQDSRDQEARIAGPSEGMGQITQKL